MGRRRRVIIAVAAAAAFPAPTATPPPLTVLPLYAVVRDDITNSRPRACHHNITSALLLGTGPAAAHSFGKNEGCVRTFECGDLFFLYFFFTSTHFNAPSKTPTRLQRLRGSRRFAAVDPAGEKYFIYPVHFFPDVLAVMK